MRTFHENPNRIHTELTFINPESAYSQNVCFWSSTKLFEASLINIVDPDQSAPVGAVSCGPTMFASLLMFNRHFKMQLFCWRFKD